MQSDAMESNWAADHLQVIRTLMERSALYRRALAPIMIYNGILGSAGAVAGFLMKISEARGFILFWAIVAGLAMAGSFVLVRRQALKESECFWSPPTRRVTQALMPALVAGAVLGGIVLWVPNLEPASGQTISEVYLPSIWVILYGCAFHAAGFFMPRGMRLFGWGFILGGCGLLAIGLPKSIEPQQYGHAFMGGFFGLLHIAYGIYLYFTERRGNEA